MGSPTIPRLSSPRKHPTVRNCRRKLLTQLDDHVPCSTDNESCADGDSLSPRTFTPSCSTWPMLSPPAGQNGTSYSSPKAATDRHTGNKLTQNGNVSLQLRKRKGDEDVNETTSNNNGNNQQHQFDGVSMETSNDTMRCKNANTSSTTPVQNGAVSRRIQELRDEGVTTDRSSDGECLYPCHECGKTFDGLLDLTDHTLQHSDKKSYQCDLCNKSFATKKEPKKHIKACHIKERQCDECGKVLITAEAFNSHMKKHHMNKDHSEDITVNISTKTSSDTVENQNEGIVNGTVEDSDEKSYECDLCEKFFATKKELKRHNKACHSNDLQCDQCGEIFTSVESLDHHRKRHHSENTVSISMETSRDTVENQNEGISNRTEEDSNEKSYQCDLCEKLLATSKELNKRKKACHKKDLQCDQCGKSFKSAEGLKNHKKKRGAQHSKTSYQCGKCGEKFFKKREFKLHRVLHEMEESYSCTQCTKTFKDKDMFLVHKKRHRKIQCKKCGLNYASNELSRHIKTVHEGIKPNKCNKCDLSFGRKYNLKRHVAYKHSGEDKEENTENAILYECDCCNKTFKKKSQLKSHQVRLEEKRFKCAHCNIPFHRKSDMKKHIRRLHSAAITQSLEQNKESSSQGEVGEELTQDGGSSIGPNLTILEDSETEDESRTGEESFPCKQCGKVFTLKDDLKDHQRKSHPVQRQFHCDRCYKSFTKKSHLNEHKDSHGRPVQCKVCEKFFKRSRNLKKHMKTFHSSNEPLNKDIELSTHDCEKCGEAFEKNVYLVQHIKRVHDENKPNKCDKCDKSFMFKSELKRHQSTHGAVKQFSCDLCGKCFGRKYNLLRHRDAHTCEEHSKPNAKTAKVHDTVKQFSCDNCNKSFGRKYHLTKHSAEHTSVTGTQSSRNVSKQRPRNESESEYDVDFSDCSETKRKRLKTAELRSDGVNETIQDCEICGKFLLTKHHLDKHMKRFHEGFHKEYVDTSSRNHRKQKSSQKSILDKKSAKQKTFNKNNKKCSENEETSQNGNPFQCDICKRVFSHEVKLSKHMKLHFPRPEDPHACTECLKMFEDRALWEIHMKKVHKKSPKQKTFNKSNKKVFRK